MPKYRNSAGSHPNDAGYYIEAKLLFNWFCRRNQLGLSPQLCLEEDNIQEYMKNQERRYLEACAELKLLTEEDFRQFRFGPKAGMMVHNLHLLLNLFKDYKGFEKYQRDYALVERLVSRLFYNNPCVSAYLLESYFISMGMSEYSAVLPMADKLKLFFAVLQVSQPPDSEYRLLVEEKIRSSKFPGHDLKIDFFLDTIMYPLEFCPRFIEQTGFSRTELGVKEAWEYFFNIPYSAFSNLQMPDSCRI